MAGRRTLRGIVLATATGALVSGGLPGSLTGGARPALAQEAQQQAQAALRYDIPAQDLNAALLAFASRAGVQIFYDVRRVQGLRSTALDGSFTPQQALTQLLSGTGIGFRFTGPSSVSLESAPATGAGVLQIDPVQVQASVVPPQAMIDNLPPPFAGGQVARGGQVGLLGNRDFMDTPFDMTTYTAQKIENQQAATVADVVNTDPSVRVTSPMNGILDAFYMRGFPIAEGNFGEMAFDGVFGVAPNYRVFTDYVERIDVIAGPTAMLFGMAPNSSVGGSINIVPKRAGATDLTRVAAEYTGLSQLGGRLDFSRRFGDNREYGLRFNAGAYAGNTQIDHQARQALVGALAFDFRGDRFRVSVDAVSQYENFSAPSRPFLLAAGVAMPTAPNGRSNVTQAWEWARITDQSGLVRAEYDILDNLTAFADVGGGLTQVDRLFGTPTILNAAGNTSSTPGNFKFNVDRLTYDGGLRGTFDTGPVHHAMALQASRYQDWLYRGSVNATSAVLSNLYAPVAQPALNVAAPTQVPKISQSTLSGVALADTLSAFNERVQLTAGLRWQQVASDNFSTVTGAVTSAYSQSVVTPMVGLLVKPWSNVALYANYIQGLSKGDIAPAAASNAGEALAPYVAQQFEVGGKIDFGRFAATLSLFQIQKPFAQLVNTVFTASGQQTNRGLEIKAFGEIVPSVRVLGGVALLDARLSSTGNVATNGNVAIGAPVFKGTLNVEWDTPFLKGLTLGAGVITTSSQYVDAANTQSIPTWTTLGLDVRYRTVLGNKPVTFRGAVQNVFDDSYWFGVASYGAVAQGLPRTFLLSAAVDF
ncbi:TonB-dependent siderophore receptor [Reyranella sp.]|uniref:TonB-dependent siderophore receptor n=1 Tax=Reyranella sp. TaxID=1929291 RepID=UPI003BAC1B3B